MLLTVTANPAIDRVLDVPQLSVGAVHRTQSVQLLPSGKGLNVARAAHTLGCKVLATGPLAGRSGQIVADLAKTAPFSADWYWLSAGETRTCTLINHRSGDATVVNEEGPEVSPEDWAGFASHVQRLASSAKAIVFAGSVPPGVAPEAFGKLARSLASGGRSVWVDTSKSHLAALLANPAGLIIKVNQTELMTGLGFTLADPPVEELVARGRMLLERGAVLVIVTRGSRGAVAISESGVWQARPPAIEVVSTVGSGDSMTAGLAAAQIGEKSIEALLAYGVACGAANALSGLPGRFEKTQVTTILPQVVVTSLG